MPAHIRPARKDDAALLPQVERSAAEAFRSHPELAWIADGKVMSTDAHLGYIGKGACWVAVDEMDEPFGFLAGEQCDRDLHIWELAVRHDRQKMGAGTALIGQAIAHARAHRLSAVTLTTFRNVAWNRPFYARLGFETLEADQLGQRLAGILRHETERGLPGHRRCAMRRRIMSDHC